MHGEENVIKKFHPHPLFYLGFYLGGPILSGVGYYFFTPLAWAGPLIIILGELLRRAETYYVTEDGVVHEFHFLATRRVSAEYRRIQNIEVTQSFLENLLGVGNIHFDTAGADRTEVNFRGVKNPYRIEKIVRERIASSA
ncbi:MAG: PH domain-containing protein [Patescibacteria group bacterium]